ncbi:SIS domain-containing protein [Kosakonia sp. BK9b]|uniref:SIS domain-containing protein n=1 Tax=Kosakonia sp. TaxID=1916651 RepID=UPI00289C2B63|nr:SIS domain-containing protein [Kosakonia sp.]
MSTAKERDTASAIMPLSATREEVSAITHYIKHHNINDARSQAAAFINVQSVRQVLLVGSGDSYALALLYAAMINSITLLPARAIQSYEFISEKTEYLDSSWLVVVLSASGRASPVLDALIKAQHTRAQVLGITNNTGSLFATQAQKLLVTQATKKGMPTQSTFAMALFLDAIIVILHPEYAKRYKPQFHKLYLYAKYLPDVSRLSRGEELMQYLFSKRVTLLGSGGNLGLATLLSNLLWCGPQLTNQVLPLEEFEHALRLNQCGEQDLVILFDCTGSQGALAYHVKQQLRKKNATVIQINNRLLSFVFSGNFKIFSSNDDCHYYAMLAIFSLIISATEKYLSCGGERISQE